MNNPQITCQPFIKTESSTLQTLQMFKIRFETFCRLLNVDPLNVARNTPHQANARNLLLLHGGDWILQKCMEHDYNNMTYVAIMDMLEGHFKDNNPRFHQIEFMSTKPKKNETLKDYVSRLRPLAQAANMDNDENYMLRIMQFYPDEHVRNKAIERNVTLAQLIEWQTTRERSEAVLGEISTESCTNQISTQSNNYRKRFYSTQNQRGNTRFNYSRGNAQSRGGSQRGGRRYSADNSHDNDDDKLTSDYVCTRCNYSGLHGPEGCYVKNRNLKCHECGERGHIAICCPKLREHNDSALYYSKNGKKTTTYKKSTRQITQETSSSDDETFETETKKIRRVKINTNDNVFKANIKMCGCNNVYILDSGSDCNLVSQNTFNTFRFKPMLRKSKIGIVDYNKNQICILGEFKSYMNINGVTKPVTFLVVKNNNVDNIIGMETLRDFNMVKFNVTQNDSNPTSKKSLNQVKQIEHNEQLTKNLNYWKQKFPALFEPRIGCVPNEYITIQIDKTIQPSQQPAYPCALALEDGARQACEELLKNDIIEELPPGTKLSWISPLHVVEKHNYAEPDKRSIRNDMLDQRKLDKKLVRITSNNKCLNKAIVKQKRLMPNIVQLRRDLNGMKYFSKVDIKSAFNTLMLDEQSRDYTVFSTPWGKLYRYKRLNMGLCIASELYQEKMTSLLSDLKNIRVAIDDILVYGETAEEERECCEALLKRLVNLNLTINDKSIFNVPELEFFGMTINEHGIKPNAHKIQSLLDMKPPQNKKDLESYLGLANYFHERIPKLAEISEPLKLLKTKNSKQFIWTAEHQISFDAIKTAISTNALGHFTMSHETELWVDASPIGVAAFLVQVNPLNQNDRKLIACKSKSFSKAERNYSQIEREGYACVWAVESFHLYLMGQHFKLMTDNKALVQIFENNDKINSKSRRITLRLQGWRSRLTQYARMQAIHVKGISNIADSLSRCLNEHWEVPTENLRLKINRISSQEIERAINRIILDKATISVDKIRNETCLDPDLKLIVKFIKEGSNTVSKDLSPKYMSILDEISMSSDGVLLKHDRIIIPKSLEQQLLQQAHQSCMGISLTTRLLKHKYFWPKMDKMIKDMIDDCLACQACVDNISPKLIIPSLLPSGKWQLVAIDFSSKTPDGNYILVLIDEFSRYPILEFTNNLTSKAAILALKSVFKQYGVPKEIKSDNGPAFISKEFAQFADECKFKHRKITPEHPQSNPMAERFMGNINKQIRCASVKNEDWKQKVNTFVQDYKATPHSTTNVTPNDLFGQHDERWPSKVKCNAKDAINTARLYDKRNKLKIAAYANKYQHAKPSKLQEGDVVLYRAEQKRAIRPNKHAPFLDPKPYKITRKQGSMIVATRPDHQVTRDVDRFKKIKQHFFKPPIQSNSIQSSKELPFISPLSANVLQENLINFDEMPLQGIQHELPLQPIEHIINQPNVQAPPPQITRRRGRPPGQRQVRRLNINHVPRPAQHLYNLRHRQ